VRARMACSTLGTSLTWQQSTACRNRQWAVGTEWRGTMGTAWRVDGHCMALDDGHCMALDDGHCMALYGMGGRGLYVIRGPGTRCDSHTDVYFLRSLRGEP
jgi:hypothetical protein